MEKSWKTDEVTKHEMKARSQTDAKRRRQHYGDQRASAADGGVDQKTGEHKAVVGGRESPKIKRR
jgi:hypothetical protein